MYGYQKVKKGLQIVKKSEEVIVAAPTTFFVMDKECYRTWYDY